MKTGWYSEYSYFVVKPLKNGYRQSLVLGAEHHGGGRWYVLLGVFPANISYESMYNSDVWRTPTSTNKNPSINVTAIALEALSQLEQEIHNHAKGKRAYIYVDGLDKRRLRVYTKVLTKKCGYKKSTALSDRIPEMHMIYKKV